MTRFTTAARMVSGRRRTVKPDNQRKRAQERLLATASLYRMIAQGFSTPQTSLIGAVHTTTLDLIAATGRGVVSPVLGPALRSVHRAWRTVSPRALAYEYSRLFLGAGLVPLREGGYGDGLRFAGQPFDIADLNGFYQAFGFELTANAPSPPDHLGTEAEFVSLLHLKRALALERGLLRAAKTADDALALFLADHLGRWVDAFDLALQEAHAAAPYAQLGTLLCRAIAVDCGRLGVRPHAAARGTAADPMAEESLVCPLATAEPVSERAQRQT